MAEMTPSPSLSLVSEWDWVDILLLCVSASVGFGVYLLIEEVLGKQIEFPVFLSDGVRSDKLELLQGKLVELVLHLPDG